MSGSSKSISREKQNVLIEFLYRKGALEKFVPISLREVRRRTGLHVNTIKKLVKKLNIQTKVEKGITYWKLEEYPNVDNLIASFFLRGYVAEIFRRNGKFVVTENGKEKGKFVSLREALSFWSSLCMSALEGKNEGKKT